MRPHAALFYCGRIFSPIYAQVMRFRALCYRHGFFRQTRLSIPVVSVGNLTLGGTGKTPMVLFLARYFSKTMKTAIVSRGYGGAAQDVVNIVSDGKEVLLPAHEAGDEPRLLADSLAGVAVVTGKRRALVGRYAQDHLDAELIIMDDGFQHMALQRDCNVVLFSASELLGNGWVFPGGPLREPLEALKRADIFVLTGCDKENEEQRRAFCDELRERFPEKPVFSGSYQAVSVTTQSGEVLSLERCSHEILYGFCGIAKPEVFQRTLASANLDVHGFSAFPDHHRFSQTDMAKLEAAARQAGCAVLLTTSKDYVKIQSLTTTLPVWVLQVELSLDARCIDSIRQHLSSRFPALSF